MNNAIDANGNGMELVSMNFPGTAIGTEGCWHCKQISEVENICELNW